MHLGVIADDVTGATDLASVLRRDGRSVIQTFGVPSTTPPIADAIVISLKTRTTAVDVATAAAQAAAAYLIDAGARQIYLKYCSTFDSTDRGNIGPVIDMLLDTLSSPFTVACPAYPALGRTVYLGHLFVGDQLLSDSSMRQHPLTPMTDANLVRVLAKQSSSQVGLVPLVDVECGEAAVTARLQALYASGHRIAITDAVLDRHIDAIARACGDIPLATGGAALGGALARVGLPASPRTVAAAAPVPSGPVAVLSGSGSTATREQVRRLAPALPHRSLDPRTLASDEHALAEVVDWACEQVRRGSVLIHSTAPSEADLRLSRVDAATLLERAFAALAVALAKQGVRAFVVAGGETAGAVIEALGVKMLGFGNEIEPGVPWTYSLEPEGFHLALKSGNFGGPNFFGKALEMASAGTW